MKVFALGGYGKTGLPAIELLARSDCVTEIAIVGRSLERAEKAAAEIGEKASAVQADGTDEQKLTSLLAGYDLIMNAADNAAVLPSLRAAIQTRAHYCDMAWGGIVDQALLLAPEAEAAGITSIVATGISPCISNLMGVHVARQLEEVEQLRLGRADIFNFENGRELTPRQWLKDPTESFAKLNEFRPFLSMALHRLLGDGIRTIRIYHDGQWVDTEPMRTGLEVPLPQGGTITAYPYVCDDPLFGSLLPGPSRAPPAEVGLSPFPPQLHALLREQALRVLEEHLDPEAALNFFYDAIEGDPHRWLALPDDYVAPVKLWVTAVGRKEGRAAWHSCWFTPAMWRVEGYFLTSVALAAAVYKILRGEIQEHGVMHAETAFNPHPFFDEVTALLPEPPPNGKLVGETCGWLE